MAESQIVQLYRQLKKDFPQDNSAALMHFAKALMAEAEGRTEEAEKELLEAVTRTK